MVSTLRVASSRKAVFLVLLMFFASQLPILTSINVEAHESSTVIWPKEGANDTGWIRLEATGADPAIGSPAIADLALTMAPGAQITNLDLELRVDGSNGLSIYEPRIHNPNSGTSLFDWSGQGMFGQSDTFDIGETFSGVPLDKGLIAVEALKKILPKEYSLTELSLKWILMHPEVSVVIPGAKTPDQVLKNIQAQKS